LGYASSRISRNLGAEKGTGTVSDLKLEFLEMAKKPKGPRSRVFLVSYSADGNIIEQIYISIDAYYDGTTLVVDSNEFRSEHGVQR
jgi:hypothetical protein